MSRSSFLQHRRHHFMVTATTTRIAVFAMIVLMRCVVPPPCTLFFVVNAKEIQATKNWTLLGENDTIAAGMHVRMDLSTGEKWVKLPDDDDETEKTQQVGIQLQGESSGVAVVATTTTENNQQQQQNAHAPPEEPEYDYDMMHRLLSQLPPEEHERMGGLPPRPPEISSGNDNTTRALTSKERELFEARMKQIWIQRQAELKQVQDELIVDLPRILKNRIQSIREYLDNPTTILQNMYLKTTVDDNDDNVDDKNQAKKDNDDDNYMISPYNLVALLADLEFHLTDLDMTRDFHTLGGWPLLASLVSPHVHYMKSNSSNNIENNSSSSNETLSSSSSSASEEEMIPVDDKVLVIRAHAAWALGTAVKNIGEFRPWVLESMPAVALVNTSNDETSTTVEFKTTTTTPLNLVVQAFLEASKSSSSSIGTTTTTILATDADNDKSKNTLKYQQQLAQKTLYALASFLRGNPLAQAAFSTMSIMTNDTDSSHDNKQSITQSLGSLIAEWVQEATAPKLDDAATPSTSSSSSLHAIKMATRLLSLADDIVNDVQLHADDANRRALTTAEQDATIVSAFSTRDWCLAIMQGSSSTNVVSSSMQAASLRALITFGKQCGSFYNSKHVVDLAMQFKRSHDNNDDHDDDERMKLFEDAIQVVSIALATATARK